MNDNVDSKTKALLAENGCHTSMKVDNLSYTWTIHQFYECHYHSKQFLESSWFKSAANDQYTWILQLSPPDSNKMIHATLFLSNGDDQVYENTLVKCKICIINGEGKETNIREQDHYQKLSKFRNTEVGSPRYLYTTFSNFLNGNDILNKDKLLLKDDTLTVFCEVHFIRNKGGTNKMTSDDFIVPPLRQANDGGLQEDFEHLLENKDFSDFTVSINDKKYPVHKTILAARSKVFATMFKQDMNEAYHNIVEICDMEEKVFVEMLRYVYTGKSPNLDDMACDLLSAAEKYDLRHLKIMCEHSLMKKLSIETVVNTLILADMFHAVQLKQKAIQFIKLHIKAVKKTKTGLKMKGSDLFDEVFDALFP